MNDHNRRLVLIAAGVSVLLHAAAALAVFNIPLGRLGGELFLSRPPIEVDRTEVRPADPGEFFDVPTDVESMAIEDDAAPSQRMWRELVERTDLSRLNVNDRADDRPLPEPDDAPATEAPEPRVEPATPGEAKVVDAAGAALRRLDTAVRLPEYVAPTDEIDPPSDSAGPVDLSRLLDAEAIDAATGGGGTGIPGALGDGAGDAATLSPTTTTARNASKPSDTSGGGGGVRIDTNIPMPDLAEPFGLPGADKPDAIAERLDDDFQYVLLTYDGPAKERSGLPFFGSRPERDPGTRPWFEVQIRPRHTLRRLPPLAKDVVYVLDTSGSIEDKWLGPVKQGLVAALQSLNDNDRFNIVRFKETVQVLSPDGLLDATDENRRRAQQFIEQAAVAGYTDVNQALGKLVQLQRSSDRVYQVVFISDGQPTAGAINPRQIIDMFTRANNLVAAVYAVSVGDKPDTEFLQALAYRNKGYVRRPARWNAASDTIADLASRLRYPIMRDASFSAAGVDTEHLFPRQPRDIYKDDPVSLFGRYDDQAEVIRMEIRGDGATGPMAFAFSLPFDHAAPGSRRIAVEWAAARMHHLYGELLRSGRTNEPAIRKLIERLREKYDLDE